MKVPISSWLHSICFWPHLNRKDYTYQNVSNQDYINKSYFFLHDLKTNFSIPKHSLLTLTTGLWEKRNLPT